MILIQRGNAESSVGRMKPSAIQQMIAQHAHRQPFHEIHMKRFGYKPVSTNFTFFCHRFNSFGSDIFLRDAPNIRSPAQNSW